ncbi:MAG: DNA-3-methyladenine glycosylase 2 family protein [Chloroflexota bacterium]
MTSPTVLDDATLAPGLQYLTDRDSDLARIVIDFGPPPLWSREPGFSTLIHIILEQQVSLASAKAAHDKLLAIATPLTPERFLTLDDATLKTAGFSRQKTAYSRYLAEALIDGSLDLATLSTLDDDAVRAELTKIKGIGPWTANIYLLMVLRRPDIWPVGDLALVVAAQYLKNLPARPKPHELEQIGEAWRPWRSVAARLLWHYYLSR